MINYYLKLKARQVDSVPPSLENIQESKKVLFSIFTRYGDTIINLIIIKEFINKFPKKNYLILCPKQMYPYVHEFLPGVECIGINKRNLIEMIRINSYLKKNRFDVGFNPWSHGLESCFFLTYCKKYLFYKDFNKPKIINHYEVVRKYLKLPEKPWLIRNYSEIETCNKVLICPESTDEKRSIKDIELDILIKSLKNQFLNLDITIASMNHSYFRQGCKSFKFKKTSKCSHDFLKVIRSNDLIVCCDSGPLHIAIGLRKYVYVFLHNSKPEIVLNTQSSLKLKNFTSGEFI